LDIGWAAWMMQIGGFCSAQCIALPEVPAPVFESWSQPDGLTRMLSAYFTVAENMSAKLVRMRLFPSRPTFQFAFTGVTLIQMGQPMFEIGLNRRAIGVSVDGGILSMPSSRARLMIELIRRPSNVQACTKVLA
jgi:hypothetical protein